MEYKACQDGTTSYHANDNPIPLLGYLDSSLHKPPESHFIMHTTQYNFHAKQNYAWVK